MAGPCEHSDDTVLVGNCVAWLVGWLVGRSVS